VAVRKIRRGREFFVRLIARRDRDGLTWRETAESEGVPLPTLMDWARRLRGSGFVELAAGDGSEPVDRVEVVLRSGRRLLVPLGVASEELFALVVLLERTC
jgi:hypothetical protein